MGRGDLSARASRRVIPLLVPALLVGAVLQAACATPRSVHAASPTRGTIDGSAPVVWDFAPVGGPTGAADSFALTVQLPQPAATFYAPHLRQGSTHAAVLRIDVTWTAPDTSEALFISATDPGGNGVGNDSSAATSDPNGLDVFVLQDPLNTTYTINASNFTGNTPTAVASHAVATLTFIDLAAQPQSPEPPAGPLFSNYHIPLSLMPPLPEETTVLGGRAFGEPSIGVDPRPGHDQTMYQAGLYTIKVTFNDSTTPATATYADVTDAPFTSTASEDAILDVDRNTGRTFVSQLTAVCSLGAVSDDDGATWTQATKPCQTPPAVDHETIGAGPFAAPLPPGAVYPDAVYYCSQNVAAAECALSLDGGLNYGVASQMWTSSTCFGLHGHIKIAPNDGTAYVPNKACGAPECLITTSTAGPNCHPGFAVSTNNGLTWTVHTINDGHTRYFNTGDPSIGIGAAGTIYFGYGDRDGHPKIAVCTGQGATCGASVDVGAAFNIVNTEMATVIAGDDNRAAFAFLGSTTPGDDQQYSFVGTWHLYVAVTYDGGAHWSTSDATPDNPIQRGCIELNANRCPRTRGTNDQRNLLDFNDLTIDREGRILASYTDGCQPETATPAGHGTCLTDATRLSGLPTEIEGPAIARQNCGVGLYAAFDATAVACTQAPIPEAPRVGLLLLGGLFTVGAVAVARRRRRMGLAASQR